jgi:hypothetical protein
MSETTIISKETHLQALALYTMAAHHSVEASRFYSALKDLLNCDDTGNLSDAIFGLDNPKPKDFETALRREGYVVEKEAKQRSADHEVTG